MANVLLGVTGSVAAIKTPQLVQSLLQAGHAVKVVTTEAALYFFDPGELTVPVLRDADEWPGRRYHRGDDVLHIELRRWADLFLLAPLDANTLAKLAVGLSDNCLTCVWRAWDATRPVVLAPAMNTLMWENPLTIRHFRQLAADAGIAVPGSPTLDEVIAALNEGASRLRVVPPDSRLLACGDIGVGALADVDCILGTVGAALAASAAE
jgi:phosphopantothenoylcysteine decarboxylase